jgi:hypothetical protein
MKRLLIIAILLIGLLWPWPWLPAGDDPRDNVGQCVEPWCRKAVATRTLPQ